MLKENILKLVTLFTENVLTTSFYRINDFKYNFVEMSKNFTIKTQNYLIKFSTNI